MKLQIVKNPDGTLWVEIPDPFLQPSATLAEGDKAKLADKDAEIVRLKEELVQATARLGEEIPDADRFASLAEDLAALSPEGRASLAEVLPEWTYQSKPLEEEKTAEGTPPPPHSRPAIQFVAVTR